MEEWSLPQLEDAAEEFEAAVRRTPGISAACSGLDWSLSAFHHFREEASARRPFIYHEDGHWVVLADGPILDEHTGWAPLEAAWCFACPLIGPRVAMSFGLFQKVLDVRPAPPFILLSGLARGGEMEVRLRGELTRRGWSTGSLPMHVERLLDLSSGAEAWLRRRSVKFRAGLRRSERLAHGRGVTFVCEAPRDGERVLERVLGVERRSWKARAGESIFQGEDQVAFYRELFTRGAARGNLRTVFAREGGVDVAYAVGACFGAYFRGYQMSYDEAYRGLGLGNLCQWELLKQLPAEGVHTYDTGMDVPYKARWADFVIELGAVVAWPG